MGVGVLGGPTTYMHMHACVCMGIMLKYTCIEMANSHLHGSIRLSCLTCMYVYTCLHACACLHVLGIPPTTPPIPRGDPPNQSKFNVLNEMRYFNSVWRFQIFGHSFTYGWMYGLVGGWIDGWGHVKSQKNLINVDLIGIIQFCLMIYDLWTVTLWVSELMDGWLMSWLMGGVRSNH